MKVIYFIIMCVIFSYTGTAQAVITIDAATYHKQRQEEKKALAEKVAAMKAAEASAPTVTQSVADEEKPAVSEPVKKNSPKFRFGGASEPAPQPVTQDTPAAADQNALVNTTIPPETK